MTSAKKVQMSKSPAAAAPETPRESAPPRISDVVALAEELFGATVAQITAPGGRTRASLRVDLGDRTVIATWRPRKQRREMEILLLKELHAAGAGVPEYLGGRGEMLFQSDAGSRRLTAELGRAETAHRQRIATRAFESLWSMKQAAHECGLLQKLPTLGLSKPWMDGFAAGPRRLSAQLDVAPPDVDADALAQSLACLPTTFLKWDARPGNAAVQPDGSVVWFDWEHAGRRQGTEDFAFLMGDEFWPLSAQDSVEIFDRTAPSRHRGKSAFLIRFTVLHVVHRLRLIATQKARHGWAEADTALRYDKIGTAPECVSRLCALGRDYALLDPRTAALAAWFGAVDDNMRRAG